MKNIIECKIINLTWKPWYWKTFLALLFASYYHEKYWKKARIYSNVDFYHNYIKLNKSIKTLTDIDLIEPNDYIPWLVVIDEVGLNVNARRSMSDQNLDITTKLGALARKLNVNVVYIWQLDRMLDVYLRELAFININMLKPTKDPDYTDGRLIFHSELTNWKKHIWFKDFYLFTLLDLWYKYNSMEKSIIEKDKTKEQQKKKKQKEFIVF